MTAINSTGCDRRLFMRIMGTGVLLALMVFPLAVHAQAAAQAPLKIGMIGAGREGGALGTALVKAGHPVMFSSRHPEELKGLVDGLGPLAKAGTVAQAIDFGDVVMIVAVPFLRASITFSLISLKVVVLPTPAALPHGPGRQPTCSYAV